MPLKYVQTRERQTSQRGSEKMDDIIHDTVIVTKIKEKDTDAFKEIEEKLIQDGHLEKEQIALEYKTIITKQLHMLKADERGREALQNEITEMRQRQEKRTEALRTRAKVLEVEKERAKQIANRLPPLPRSVKLLLKEKAKDFEFAKKDSIANIAFLEETIENCIENSEDKENIDERYLLERQKIQEDMDKKAKKRFKEALKKDRQKQEHDAILREIENAEKLSRRQMAKNITEHMGKVPCHLPDKLHHAEKQVAIENAIEDIFRKKNSLEHTVEDPECYPEVWDIKCSKIDSATESNIVDYVPSFLKENYSYLLQEETTVQCGQQFSGLDDSKNLNEAFIELPADMLNASTEIDAIISQLDQMRVELNETYEKEIKPLLEDDVVPKVISLDKSVEADLLKLPTEDKAIEAGRSPAPLSSRSTQANILQGGVMNDQRRDLGKFYKLHTSNSGRYLPQYFACQSDTVSDARSLRSDLEAGSSSSYLSLPPKHGLPNVYELVDSPGRNTPLVEDKKLHKDCIPLAKSLRKQSDDLLVNSLTATNVSSVESSTARHSSSDEFHLKSIELKLTTYIQLVADQYLKKASSDLDFQKKVSSVTDCISAETDSKVPTAFSKIKVPEKGDVFDRKTSSADPAQAFSSSSRQLISIQNKMKKSSAFGHDEAGLEQYDKLKLNLQNSSEYSLQTNMNSSGDDELLQSCREVIATNISDTFSNLLSAENISHSSELIVSTDVVTEPQIEQGSFTGYLYHDLSTITEMDSALTNNTEKLYLNGTLDSLGKNSLSKNSNLEDILDEEINTISASLVDAPPEVSEIAKGIQFIRQPVCEPIEMAAASVYLSDPQSQSMASKVQIPQDPTPSIQLPSADQISSSPFMMDAKTSDGSHGLLMPSSVSSLKYVSTTKSQPLPYSSSLRDSKTTQSSSTSMSALSKYFQDISCIRHDGEQPSKGLADTPTSVQIDVRRQVESQQSSSGAFLLLTPHSYLSTPSKISGKQKDHEIIKKSDASSLQNQNAFGVFKAPESFTNSFKSMTPHSYYSCVDKTSAFSSRKNTQHASHINICTQKNIDSNLVSFKRLSLSSNYPTLKDASMTQANIFLNEKVLDQDFNDGKKEYQNKNTTGSNFQPMTPHSQFSSLNNIHTSSTNSLKEFSNEKQLKKESLNFKLGIHNSFENQVFSQMHEEPDVQQDSAKDKFFKGHLSARQMTSSEVSPKKYSHSEDIDVQRDTIVKKAVKVPSSGFIPKLSLNDFTTFDRDKLDKNKKGLFFAKMSTPTKSNENLNADSSSITPKRFLLSSNPDGMYEFSKSSKPIMQELFQHLASSPAILCITHSNDSIKNHSERFAESKIACQSTRVKSIEDIIQETGILEEPSLTLMNTELTMRPDSPERTRSFVESLLREDLKTPSTLQSDSFSSNTLDMPSNATSGTYYCDSPSMLSFLRHEQSCLNTEEKKLSAKKTPQNEYKKRTKRLWNNLEEIQRKKATEEKKEKMRKNRLKMKTYSKKLTKIKKN